MSNIRHFDYGLRARIGIPIGIVAATIWPLIPSLVYMAGDILSHTPVHFRFVWTKIPLAACVIVAFVWAVGVCAPILTLRGKCSLTINDDGVTAFMLGLRWRRFPWREIDKIEKQRIYAGGQFGNITYVNIFKKSKVIRFYQSIKGYDGLVAVVDAYVSKFDIPVLFQDRGYDTVQAAKAKTDRKNWRQINREGVRTSVKQL